MSSPSLPLLHVSPVACLSRLSSNPGLYLCDDHNHLYTYQIIPLSLNVCPCPSSTYTIRDTQMPPHPSHQGYAHLLTSPHPSHLGYSHLHTSSPYPSHQGYAHLLTSSFTRPIWDMLTCSYHPLAHPIWDILTCSHLPLTRPIRDMLTCSHHPIRDMLTCSHHTLTYPIRDMLTLLTGTQCSDDDVIRCLACPLQSLELKMCVRVSMVGLQHVSKMDGCDLTHLGLAHCPQVDPDCASQFPSMFPSLTSLDLRLVPYCAS